MPAVVNAPQEPSKLKTTLLAPVRWLVIGVLAVLFIIFALFALAFFFITKAFGKLYHLAGGRLPEELEERAAAFQAVINTPQTTHNTDVNNAVNLNVQALRNNYGEPDIEDEFIKEIEDFINESKYKENEEQDPTKYKFTEYEAQYALKCLQRIKISTETHSICGLKLKQILNLVWKACNDKSKESAEPNIDINKRIIQRKYQLVKQLIEAQTEYAGTHVCFTGTFNAIISSLHNFKEFPFEDKVDKNVIKSKFEDDLKKKGEELFNQLSNEEKKQVAEALSNPSTNFFLNYIESFKDHPACAVLGEEKCYRLVREHFENLQYNNEVAQYTR